MKRLAIFLLPCLLGACLTSPKECVANPSDPSKEVFGTSLGINLDSMTKTSIGDWTKDLAVGTGTLLDSLQVVQINYTAYLANGTQVDTQTDYPIDLSTVATIGLADGMFGMNVGGQRLIVVPSALGLGACPKGVI